MGEPRAVLEAADPVAAFGRIARSDGWLALPTSGTSGVGRVVVRSARSWVDSFEAVTALTGLRPDSRVWLPGPLSATMNLFGAVHAAAVGARLVDSIDRASHAHLTPSQLQAVLDGGADLAGRRLIIAGDVLPPSLRRRAERCGARVAHYYGAAELSFVAWGTDADDLRPFPGVEATIRNGQIWVRSPYIAGGYLGGVGGPLQRDADGYVTVGDRGHFDGDRLVVDGRPEAIITGGATVLVADVESILRPVAHGQLAVLGLPHPRLGQVVAAVLTEEADRAPARAAASALGTGRPRRWFVRSTLPVTAAGKVDRRRLAAELGRELESGPHRP